MSLKHETPEIFGTSLIDLLIGSLTLVSLLWVLNSLNSGYKGRGEVDNYSAFASIGQFGVSHINSLEIGEEGYWHCECSKTSSSNLNCTPCNINSGVRSKEILVGGDGFGLSITHKNNKELDKAVNIIIRIIPENADYTGGIQINVENIDDKIKALIRIGECCSNSEPHYIRVVKIAPGIEEKDLLLWHNESELRHVLQNNKNDSWITFFKTSAADYFNKRYIMPFPPNGACSNTERTLELEFDEDDGINLNLPLTSKNTPNIKNLQKDLYQQLKKYSLQK